MTDNSELSSMPEIPTVQHLVLRSARVFGDKLALEDLKETPLPRVTHASLLDAVLRFGTALRSLGLPERSHVAVLGENRVQWGIGYLTCMCFNYVVVPVDAKLSINEILNILHESEATAIIYSEAFAPLLSERRLSMKQLKFYVNMDAPDHGSGVYSMPKLLKDTAPCRVEDLPRIDAKAMAAILFTSGSLGKAKGVMLSQHNIASNIREMSFAVRIPPEDRFLSVLPIHHAYECTCGFLCPLYNGASVSYARSLKTVVDDLKASRATMLLAVPLLYDKMFRRITKGIQEKRLTATIIGPLIKATDLLARVGWSTSKRQVFHEIHERFGGSIRLFIAGGAAQDPMVSKGLRSFGFTLLQGYGLTETSPILTVNRVENFRDDAAGLPLPGVTLKIHDPGPDGVGEIWAKGPNVMLGYYKNDAATAATFEDGWFKTGDLGRIDDDGFLHISGRVKNVIISKSGKNVYPEEIEDVLHRSPYLLECMVFGEADPKLGEIIAAQVVVDAEAFIELSQTKGVQITPELINKTVDEEIEQLNKHLAPFKQVRKFYVREKEFEKTTTQKIKRHLAQTTA
ncbi:MAG: AMP-dependent synthetase and ligase [Bacteroidetes bacterium]|nr:AMP-dependent synthetase and ligase [Bacteroidota bacterium]